MKTWWRKRATKPHDHGMTEQEQHEFVMKWLTDRDFQIISREVIHEWRTKGLL